MAGAAVALLLLGAALAEAQTYTLDLDQPQKVRCAAAQQLKLQPRLQVTPFLMQHGCMTSQAYLRNYGLEEESSPAHLVPADLASQSYEKISFLAWENCSDIH